MHILLHHTHAHVQVYKHIKIPSKQIAYNGVPHTDYNLLQISNITTSCTHQKYFDTTKRYSVCICALVHVYTVQTSILSADSQICSEYPTF